MSFRSNEYSEEDTRLAEEDCTYKHMSLIDYYKQYPTRRPESLCSFGRIIIFLLCVYIQACPLPIPRLSRV